MKQDENMKQLNNCITEFKPRNSLTQPKELKEYKKQEYKLRECIQENLMKIKLENNDIENF